MPGNIRERIGRRSNGALNKLTLAAERSTFLLVNFCDLPGKESFPKLPPKFEGVPSPLPKPRKVQKLSCSDGE